MALGLLTLHLHIPGCQSLKEKRSRLKPLLARLRREFNISVAEIEHNDAWQSAVIACAAISNSAVHTQRYLNSVIVWIENNRPDMTILDDQIEMIS